MILKIVLKENFQPRLPCVLTHEDYMLVVVSLPDSSITALFHDLYANNENLVPPAYELKSQFLAQQEVSNISRLIDLMMGIFSREQKDLQAFYSSYQSQVFSSLNNKTLIANNTVVILKTVLLDDSHDEDGVRYLPSNLSHLMADVVKSVKIECSQENIVQLELLPVTSSDNQPDAEHVNVMRIQRMCQEVKENLNKCLLRAIAHREVKDRDIATGVPKSLIEELVTQALYYQKLTNVQPLLESSMLTNLHDYACNVTAMPIIVQAEPGWGLSTMWAQLVKSFVRARPGTIFIYRSIGISPDSQTLLSTVLSIQQQLDIILGPKTSTKKDSNRKQTQVVETLLQDIVNRSTKAMPIMIILEGITLASSHSRELDILTFSQQLPATTKLVLMTSNSDVLEGLRAKMKDAFFLKTIKWDKETIVHLFNEYLAKTKHKLSEIQLAFVKAAIHRCPLPLYAVMVAKLAVTWHNSTEVGEDVMPGSLDKIINIFFEYMETIIPSDCYSAMMAYFTGSMGGICKWEMEDLLSVNDSVLLSINSDVKNPLIHRAPPVLWKSILFVFKPFLNLFVSQHFYSHSWASNSVKKSASARYVSSDVTSNILHRELSDHFLGRWSEKKKPYPDPEEEIELLQDRFILPQPEQTGKHYNVRKLMCLPYHLMKSKNKNAYVLETCILSLSWLENKINAVSVLQLVCDLELAKTMETSCSGDIQFMQEILLTYASSLAPNGREVYKLLRYHITKEKKSGNKKLSVKNNGLSKFYYSLSNPPWSFLCLLDPIPDVCSTSSSSVDAIVPLSHDLHETHVAIILKSQGEIKIINIVTNVCVRTLTGLDLPQTLTILNSPTAVVLCNRELCIINLDEGRVVTKLRGVLNLRLPLFGLQNKQRVVVLSRDRMVVNILDIETDSIVASFKAGETRFLDSLILSEDGSVLVCGDETQKPFPLLVWSLVECKLLHDIRMAKHEFLTHLAAISSDGHYLACGCREVDELDSNFVTLFDLRSGHLMKKIRSDAMCTAVAVSSKLMSVVVVLDTGQLSIWDIISGNHRCLIDGAKVACDTITLTPDGKKCLTFCRQDMSISSRTISLWSIETGEFIASQTFESSITSAYLSPDGQMVLVGVKGHSQPIRLLLVPAGSSIKTTKKRWEMDSGSKVFGDIRRHEATINVAMTTDT